MGIAARVLPMNLLGGEEYIFSPCVAECRKSDYHRLDIVSAPLATLEEVTISADF